MNAYFLIWLIIEDASNDFLAELVEGFDWGKGVDQKLTRSSIEIV